jgi:hypothetical protein
MFEGRAGLFSHMLLTQQMASKATGADVLHFNSLFEEQLKDSDETAARCAASDAVEIRF